MSENTVVRLPGEPILYYVFHGRLDRPAILRSFALAGPYVLDILADGFDMVYSVVDVRAAHFDFPSVIDGITHFDELSTPYPGLKGYRMSIIGGQPLIRLFVDAMRQFRMSDELVPIHLDEETAMAAVRLRVANYLRTKQDGG